MDNKLKTTIKLYISGSQGVSPNERTVTYGIDFNTIEELKNIFIAFINENAEYNIDSYLEDYYDYDYDDVMNEAVADSGEFLIFLNDDDEPTFEYSNGSIENIKKIR